MQQKESWAGCEEREQSQRALQPGTPRRCSPQNATGEIVSGAPHRKLLAATADQFPPPALGIIKAVATIWLLKLGKYCRKTAVTYSLEQKWKFRLLRRDMCSLIDLSFSFEG